MDTHSNDDPPPASQASSHFPFLEPVSGDILYGLEVKRRQDLRRRGRVRTGCREIDDAVLKGGFDRGSVVGVSAEDGDVGLLVSILLLFIILWCMVGR